MIFSNVQTQISRLSIVLILLIAGCAFPQKPLPKEKAFNPAGGYIAGVFFGECQEYGFGIENVETRKTFFMSFFPLEPSLRGALGGNVKSRPEQTSIISVPPGRYKIIYWAFYESTMNSMGVKKTIEQPKEFEVLSGRVTVLGRFEVTQRAVSTRTVELAINPRPISKTRFKEIFSADYPNIPVESLYF